MKDLRARMREIARSRVRYGYRRIHVLLKLSAAGTSWDVTVKRVRTVSVTVRRTRPSQIEVSGQIGDERKVFGVEVTEEPPAAPAPKEASG